MITVLRLCCDLYPMNPHPGQCDLFVKYPYDDVPTCLSKEDRKNLSEKLAKELADISAWSG